MMEMEKIVKAMTRCERIVSACAVSIILFVGGIGATQEHPDGALVAVVAIALLAFVGTLVKMLVRLHGEVNFIRGQNYEASRETARKMGLE